MSTRNKASARKNKIKNCLVSEKAAQLHATQSACGGMERLHTLCVQVFDGKADLGKPLEQKTLLKPRLPTRHLCKKATAVPPQSCCKPIRIIGLLARGKHLAEITGEVPTLGRLGAQCQVRWGGLQIVSWQETKLCMEFSRSDKEI